MNTGRHLRHLPEGLTVTRYRRPLLLTILEGVAACVAGVGLALLAASCLGLL
jgi:hypothetical protein